MKYEVQIHDVKRKEKVDKDVRYIEPLDLTFEITKYKGEEMKMDIKKAKE